MRHFLMRTTEVFGCHEATSYVVFNCDDQPTEEDCLNIARFERGALQSDYDESMNGYWFDGNITKEADIQKELTEAEYEVLAAIFCVWDSQCLADDLAEQDRLEA